TVAARSRRIVPSASRIAPSIIRLGRSHRLLRTSAQIVSIRVTPALLPLPLPYATRTRHAFTSPWSRGDLVAGIVRPYIFSRHEHRIPERGSAPARADRGVRERAAPARRTQPHQRLPRPRRRYGNE